MSDRLEDFIRKNRAELDIDDVPSNLWQGIEVRIPNQKRRRLRTVISMAASVLILVAAAYFMGMSNSKNALNKEVFASESQFLEFKEASSYYTTTIDYKLTEAKNAGVDEDVLNDLKQLDEVYNELKEEMLTTEYQDKEFLINLMINNYKTKIDILEKIINKNKGDENKITNDETINI